MKVVENRAFTVKEIFILNASETMFQSGKCRLNSGHQRFGADIVSIWKQVIALRRRQCGKPERGQRRDHDRDPFWFLTFTPLVARYVRTLMGE